MSKTLEVAIEAGESFDSDAAKLNAVGANRPYEEQLQVTLLI